MKLTSLIIALLLAAALAVAAPSVHAQNEDEEDAPQPPHQQQRERTVASTANVIVTVCIASGDVTVHGWDRAEVQAHTTDAEQLELQRNGPAESAPATRVEVFVSNMPPTQEELTCDCSASSNITLNVPRGATVQ